MTKGEKLIWELFLMVRELMPATPDNAARQTEWARIFHEMEHPTPPLVEQAPIAHDDIAEDPELVDDEVPEDPHEHGVPARTGKRKKK